MTSGQRYTPTEHWYRPGSDRSAVGQKKIEELQRQLASMQHDMNDRTQLKQKLDRLQEIEREKRNAEEKVLERNSRNGTPRLLHSEMERLYGKESPLDRGHVSPAVDKNVIETVIKHRTKEFSARQQEAALKANNLLPDITDISLPGDKATDDKGLGVVPVQGVDSYINTTMKKLPDSMGKIWKMREDLQHHYNYYRRPYNGELGLGSYEPWQIQDYFMCRDVVNDVVENFLNLYFLHDDVVEKGTYKAMLDEDKLWRQRQSESLAEKRAVHLIAEEMIIDETGTMIDETLREMYHMYRTFGNMSDVMLMSVCETVSTGKDRPRDPSDRAYNMITKGWFGIKENRNSHRDEIWGHSQYVQNKVSKRKITRKAGGEEVVEEVEEEEEEEEDFDAPDLTILDFNTISPVQIRSLEPSLMDSNEIKLEKEAFRRYSRREIDYWGNMRVKVQQLTYDKKCHGIRLIRASPNHRFMAVGTFHGDVVVYDALMEPLRPFRVLAYLEKNDEPITDVSWSIDSTRITVINTLGQLRIFSVISGSVVSQPAIKLGLTADTGGIYPFQLQLLLKLDVDKQDFIFQQGALAEEGAQDDVGLAPEKAAFFPSISFFGTQNDMVVSLDNGDILKCNVQDALKSSNPEQEPANNECPRIYRPLLIKEDEATDINTIGQNVEAELLRGHKKGLLYLCFVEFLNAMITVDQKGFIFKWKYNMKYKSSFGWYIPSRKFKLETTKIMYKESDKDKPKIVFTDQVAPGKKPRTRQDVAAERRRVQNTIDNMQLGEPWHEEYLDDEEMQLQIYAPRGVIADTGAMFHIVYRDPETNLLSTYVTRLYKPVKVRCTRIVRVIGSPTSTDLVVLLLFPAYPPKGPHFTVFMVDLKTMELKDFRKDLPLTVPEYTLMMTKTIISLDVTRVLGATATDYLFIVFNGNLRCISLTSGQIVAKNGTKPINQGRRNVDDEDDDDDEDQDEPDEVFKGSIVDETLLSFPPDAECTVLSFEGKIHCIIFARKQTKMDVVTFKDMNKYPDRRAMWKTYTTLQSSKLVPAELRVNTHEWKLDDIQHPTVAVRKILMRKIDMEMRKAGLIRDHPKLIKRIALSDKVENYRTMDRAIAESSLLDKEAVMQRRAASRQDTVTPPIEDEEKF